MPKVKGVKKGVQLKNCESGLVGRVEEIKADKVMIRPLQGRAYWVSIYNIHKDPQRKTGYALLEQVKDSLAPPAPMRADAELPPEDTASGT